MRNARSSISGLLAALAAALFISPARAEGPAEWPFLKHYDQGHLARIALPLGGIGTGTVSLGGRGDLRDWEIANRPAKGFNPAGAFFAIRLKPEGGPAVLRALQGPVEGFEYEGSEGAEKATNPGLPCFRECSFDASYPLGQVNLADSALPVKVRLRAFNPMVPADLETSGIPVAILTYEVTNVSSAPLDVTVCGSLPNFIGNNGTLTLAKGNRNAYREGRFVRGLLMSSEGVDPAAESWGTIALTTPVSEACSFRTSWLKDVWGTPLLDLWDDLADDGILTERAASGDMPRGSLAVRASIPAGAKREFRFFLTWHFPNLFAWSETRLGNYYATLYKDAWDAAEKTAAEAGKLEDDTVAFVSAFCHSDMPTAVKEAALFNLSTLRSQTCFRAEDGRFYAWEGCYDKAGCCFGSCTHVWNYEQAIAFLYGDLARSLREVEFGKETGPDGQMNFRAKLPFGVKSWGKAAADGQMGCIMKLYRDWQLAGDDAMLKTLWPSAKRAVEFCWIPGGWDANKDGVMEGCQHNTMDVEYYGPNPEMEFWYLGALQAASKMAARVGDKAFAKTCAALFAKGSLWTDANLFNGRYYVQKVVPPMDAANIAPGLLVGMGSTDFKNPDYQLANGCLVDQLVGQLMAHVCGLGYLARPENVRTALGSVMAYNHRDSFTDIFNPMRSFALGDESGLLIASYPDGRPANPFPYFAEVWTGLEYTAAAGMLYEGQTGNGLKCVADARARYDGLKRNPYDEAECGHHYGRAMASWGAVLALTGFRYSAVNGTFELSAAEGTRFWSNGYAYGTVEVRPIRDKMMATVTVAKGRLPFRTFILTGFGKASFPADFVVDAGEPRTFEVLKARKEVQD